MHTDDPSHVFAVDKNTGKTQWKVERPTDAKSESPDNYAIPQLATVGGKPQLIISGADYVTGHDHRDRKGGVSGGADRARDVQSVAAGRAAPASPGSPWLCPRRWLSFPCWQNRIRFHSLALRAGCSGLEWRAVTGERLCKTSKSR